MISPVSDNNVRALFADLGIYAENADAPVDLVIDHFSQWTDNHDGMCAPTGPTIVSSYEHAAA